MLAALLLAVAVVVAAQTRHKCDLKNCTQIAKQTHGANPECGFDLLIGQCIEYECMYQNEVGNFVPCQQSNRDVMLCANRGNRQGNKCNCVERACSCNVFVRDDGGGQFSIRRTCPDIVTGPPTVANIFTTSISNTATVNWLLVNVGLALHAAARYY